MLEAMKSRTYWSVLLLALSGGILGCGGGGDTASAPSAQVHTTNLAGNWLLVGAVPVFPAPISGGTRIAMTFSVDGEQLSGFGEYFVSCGNTGGGAGVSVQGTIAADGSFVAQTTQTVSGAGASLVVKGRVPSVSGTAWSGSYSLDTTNAGTCKVQAEDTLTASPIGSFSGTYTGTGTILAGASQMAASVKLVLQQGSTVQDAAGQSFTDAALLNGTIAVTGSACFSTGSIVIPANVLTLGIASVSGDSVHPSFRMNDGSTLALNASASDASGNTLQTSIIGVLGGNCATSPTQTVRITNLTRAN